MRLASRFGAVNFVRRDRPLTRDELAHYVPSVFSEEKHESRSERYTCIPTITLLDNLQREGFQPFFACQTRVRNPDKREHTKHMLRLRRHDQINGKEVPEIILLNSHDGSSSYQMLPGLFREVCQNGLICGESFWEVRVPHKGNVVEKVVEGAYEVLDRKPIPDNRGDISTRLMEHIRDNPTKGVYEDELFSIRYFQKETAHITFKRGDLTEKMNDMVTKHYPGYFLRFIWARKAMGL